MEKTAAIEALGALAQDSRLEIFRLLIQAGPEGRPVGYIAERLGLPSPTLSFHLSQLKRARLVSCRRNGRSLIYAADFEAMGALMAYLTENCCGGGSVVCGLGSAAEPSSEAADEIWRRKG